LRRVRALKIGYIDADDNFIVIAERFDRLDNYFAKFGFATNDVADALSELVVICWEFVNQGLPNVPTENSDGIAKIRDEISQRIADSGALAVYSDTDKQMLAVHFGFKFVCFLLSCDRPLVSSRVQLSAKRITCLGKNMRFRPSVTNHG
jgi:hypothetical protein